MSSFHLDLILLNPQLIPTTKSNLTQPHDAAAENGYLELCNYLRGVCGLEALEQLPDEEGDGDDEDMGDDSPNQQDAQEEEAMAE